VVCLSVCPVGDVGVLCPNGYMNQDETWHGSRPLPGLSHIVLDGDPAPPPQKGHSLQFSAHVGCGQTAEWIKMPLGTKTGVAQGDIVLDGDPALPSKKEKEAQQPPNFRPVSGVLKRLDGSRCHSVWR